MILHAHWKKTFPKKQYVFFSFKTLPLDTSEGLLSSAGICFAEYFVMHRRTYTQTESESNGPLNL